MRKLCLGCTFIFHSSLRVFYWEHLLPRWRTDKDFVSRRLCLLLVVLKTWFTLSSAVPINPAHLRPFSLGLVFLPFIGLVIVRLWGRGTDPRWVRVSLRTEFSMNFESKVELATAPQGSFFLKHLFKLTSTKQKQHQACMRAHTTHTDIWSNGETVGTTYMLFSSKESQLMIDGRGTWNILSSCILFFIYFTLPIVFR